MVNNVPEGWNGSTISLGRDQMPYVAAATLAGGNLRVGLEDNLYRDKGVLASNTQLVERAASLLSKMGSTLMVELSRFCVGLSAHFSHLSHERGESFPTQR